MQHLPNIKQIAAIFHKHEHATIGGERYVSQFARRTERSTIVMASWAGECGQINQDQLLLRPGKILFLQGTLYQSVERPQIISLHV